MSDEHFTVDGTLLEACASLKSFRKIGEGEEPPPDDPGNPTVDFHGEKAGGAIVYCAILRFVSETSLPTEVSPQDIQRHIDAGEPLVLIDVREPEEFVITRIEGATLIPMRNIPASLRQLKAKARETTLIVFCHHGVRSLNVVHWLREQGVPACQSMAGGIDAWSVLVDPSVPRY
jgi:rhodanese-related sulfurtransferase